MRGQSWLCLSSLFFYGWWDWHYLGLLVPSILANFTILRLSNGFEKRASQAQFRVDQRCLQERC